MARTPSNMLELGTVAPEFSLLNVLDDKNLSFSDVKGENGTLIMFICRHCPYVIHVQDEIARIADEFMPRGVGVSAISSNDVEKYPDDAPEFMVQQAREVGFNFPYLYDETQEVARAYDAACTPDFYLFDRNDRLVYRGRLDEARPGNDQQVNGKDLRNALNSLLKGKEISRVQYPSMGCNIKWKASA